MVWVSGNIHAGWPGGMPTAAYQPTTRPINKTLGFWETTLTLHALQNPQNPTYTTRPINKTLGFWETTLTLHTLQNPQNPTYYSTHKHNVGFLGNDPNPSRIAKSPKPNLHYSTHKQNSRLPLLGSACIGSGFMLSFRYFTRAIWSPKGIPPLGEFFSLIGVIWDSTKVTLDTSPVN